MENKFNQNTKYHDLLARTQKQFTIQEGLYLIIRLYLTNNIIFYILCILFRFIPLLIIIGNYESLKENTNQKEENKRNLEIFQILLRNLTCYNLCSKLHLSDQMYVYICNLLYILFVARLFNYFIVAKKLLNKDSTNISFSPPKHQIIADHAVFLLFPYIIEFLSFSYYIYFLPDKFIIKKEYTNKLELIIISIFNTIFIIIFNLENYVYIVCSNKQYTTTDLEAYLRIKNEKKFINSKPTSYRCSKSVFFTLIFLQNFSLAHSVDNYLTSDYKNYYKIIISIVLFVTLLFLILRKFYEYNYSNYINILVDILQFYCFYTIIIDLILFITKYQSTILLFEIIYILEKFALSLLTYSLIKYKFHKYLENTIREILFQENNIKNYNEFLDAFLYLNEIMLNLKEKNDSESNVLLLKFLYKHINICNKVNCNCKLLNIFLQIQYNNAGIDKEEDINSQNDNNNNISYLLIIMNYLYESSFLEYDYFNKYEITILLAEHFCHLKNNPVMAFSFVNSLLTNKRNILSKFQTIELYELSQKYVYYIIAKEKIENDSDISENYNSLLIRNQKINIYKVYFKSLRMSYKVKRTTCNYIDNLMNILSYRNLFDETLSFKFDENNENIIMVKINFFERNSSIENDLNNSNKNFSKKDIKKFNYSSNLYKIIHLLKLAQLYYYNIIDSIKKMEIIKEVPAFIIFKYYLFFDIFEGGKIPQEISNKLYFLIYNKQNNYNSNVTNNIYHLLQAKYKEQYYDNDSKFFSIFEYKNELRTKYFSEECALRLGYQQKDLVNKKIDELMPKEFCKSHQNLIRKLFIGDQLKYYNLEKSYLFDITGTILYPVKLKGTLIFDLGKNLVIFSEIIFKYKDEYKFMLNNNFEILSTSKNFEDDYLLNQKIFHKYDLKIMEILHMKPEKLRQKFEKEFKIINYHNLLRQIKTDEYFIPQLFVPNGETSNGMFNHNSFNNTKNQILSNISNLNYSEKEAAETINEAEEKDRLIKDQKLKKEIIDFFINPAKIVVHNTYSVNLNKWNFIENIFKELTKIPYNELLADSNNINNLIIDAKKIINKLLTRNELSNDLVKVTFKLSYYYDKAFYFVTLKDEKKILIKLTKDLNNNNKTPKSPTRNFKKINTKNSSSTSLHNIKRTSKNKIDDFKRDKNEEEEKEENKIIINKIQKYKQEINKEKFIFVIKFALSIIIICIFIIYLLIIHYQGILINTTEKIVLSYFYNSHTADILEDTLSKLNAIFNEVSGVNPQKISDGYTETIIFFSQILRENYHYFKKYFLEYNIYVGHNFNVIYDKKIFYRLKGFCKEFSYYSQYSEEIDYLIHNIRSINASHSEEFQRDVDNFLFFDEENVSKEKINSSFVKLLYYLNINIDESYKEIFMNIKKEIRSAYLSFVRKSNIIYYILEIGGLFFYLIFFFVIMIYLYYSNNIIIKNIIFLFLDISEEHYSKNKNSTVNLIRLKLLKYRYLINDFDLNRLRKYFEELDILNKKKYINDEQLSRIEHENNIKSQKERSNIIKSMNNDEANKKSSNSKNENIPEKISTKKLVQNNIHNNNIKFKTKLSIQKNGSNNSSYNYLMGIDSKFLKNNLNTQSKPIDANENLYASNFMDNSNKIMLGNSHNNNIFKENHTNNNYINNLNNDNEPEIKEDIKDAILNKSSKNVISIIKKYIIIMIIFTFLITVYSLFKINRNSQFNKEASFFYEDFESINNKFSSLYFYFNNLKALFIFNEYGKKWNNSFHALETMNKDLEKLNKGYNDVLNHKMRSYKEVTKLFELLQYNKNDSSQYINKTLCSGVPQCQKYLESTDNIFLSGIDSGYKTTFTYIDNIYMDYKKLKDKKDVQEIVEKITNNQFFEFRRVRKAFSNIYFYVQQKIYSSFENDQLNFRNNYRSIISSLNIISVVFFILIFLFVFVVIFFTVYNFSGPIKDSTYRINQSFYYIKKYDRSHYRK